jgi:hypothetical protein
MKTLRLISLSAMIAAPLAFSLSLQAQVLSAKRLTQRINPQSASPQQMAPPSVGIQPSMQVMPIPADPAKMQAEKEEGLRKAAELRQQRAQEDSESTKGQSDTSALEFEGVPLRIDCKKVEPDPNEVLQSIDLSVTNACRRPITGVVMGLNYFDGRGTKLKEWTTRREFDQALPPKAAVVLAQPAYFMPLFAKRVTVDVKEVRFSDGTLWKPKPGS